MYSGHHLWCNLDTKSRHVDGYLDTSEEGWFKSSKAQSVQSGTGGRRGLYIWPASRDRVNYVSGCRPKKVSELPSTDRIDGTVSRRGRKRFEPSTPTTMFKPRLRIPRRPALGARSACASAPRNSSSPFAAAAQQQQRAIHASPARLRHNVAPLTEDGRFEKHGVPGLLSPEGFDAAYTNYQGWVLDKLNSLTEGTSGLFHPSVLVVQELHDAACCLLWRSIEPYQSL